MRLIFQVLLVIAIWGLLVGCIIVCSDYHTYRVLQRKLREEKERK